MKGSDEAQIEGQPPLVPEIRRRVFGRHIVDLAILSLLPLAALIGLTGPRLHQEVRRTATVEVAVEYPRLIRLSRPVTVRIVAINRSAAPLESLWISLPDTYLEGFGLGAVTPGPAAAHHVQLTDLAPDRPVATHVDLHAERFGFWRGTIRVVTEEEQEDLAIPLRTFIFP